MYLKMEQKLRFCIKEKREEGSKKGREGGKEKI